MLSRAADLRPGKPFLRLRAEICGPAVFETAQEIEEYCERLERVLDEWKQDTPSAASKTPSPPAPLPVGEGSKESSPPAPLPTGDGERYSSRSA